MIYIIIILLIIFVFFLSADPALKRNIIKKNSVHLIFFLVLIYFVFNHLHLGYFLIGLSAVVLYFTNFKQIIMSSLQSNVNNELNKDSISGTFNLEQTVNNLISKLLGNSNDINNTKENNGTDINENKMVKVESDGENKPDDQSEIDRETEELIKQLHDEISK